MPKLTGLSVLLLEDQADTRETIAEGLRLHGARVVEADSAAVALRLFEVEKPRVIVADRR